ncbi:hypothetical protein AZ006_000412, partial [Citrobacter freundii]
VNHSPLAYLSRGSLPTPSIALSPFPLHQSNLGIIHTTIDRFYRSILHY